MTLIAWFPLLIMAVGLAVLGYTAWSLLRPSWKERRGQRDGRVAVDVARTWATGAIIVFSLGGVGHVINALASPEVTLSNVPLGNYWPVLPPGMVEQQYGEGDERLVSGTFRVGDLVLSGLGPGTRLFLAGGELLIAVACIAVAVLIRRACSAILGGRAFDPRLRLWAWWTAIIVMVAGFGGQILKAIGQVNAANAALPHWSIDPNVSEELAALYGSGGSSVDGTVDYTEALPQAPQFGGDLTFPLTPLWVAIVIIIVVELLNAGVRLSAKNARLAKDVEGLV